MEHLPAPPRGAGAGARRSQTCSGFRTPFSWAVRRWFPG